MLPAVLASCKSANIIKGLLFNFCQLINNLLFQHKHRTAEMLKLSCDCAEEENRVQPRKLQRKKCESLKTSAGFI